jgi:hypothetical protein
MERAVKWTLPGAGDVIFNREGDIGSLFRKHDPPPTAHVEKGEREHRSMPEAFHNAPADRADAVSAAEAESLLNVRMQAGKVGSESDLVN